MKMPCKCGFWPGTAGLFGLMVVLLMSGTYIGALAQSISGALHGTVTDSSGAVIPGAAIEVRNLANAQIRTATTDRRGYYTVADLAPGEYSVTISSYGFTTANWHEVEIEVSQDRQLDSALSVGQSTTVVEVTAGSPMLSTASSTLGQTIGSRETVDLPLNGRQFTQLLLLTPGASPVEGGQQGFYTISFGAGGLSPAVNGQLGGQNVFTIDGILNTHAFIQSWAISPPPDAIQEFKSQNHIADAQFGLSSGANVNLVTKNGSEKFHGDAWEFVRNQDLDTANFFDNYSGSPKPQYLQNQYGGTLGGPLALPFYKGRGQSTHFFGYYEGFRSSQGFTLYSNVPTADELAGDFSDLLTDIQATDPTGLPLVDNLGRPIFVGQLYNPYSTRVVNGQLVRDPIPGNNLSAVMPRNQAALTYLNALYPAANYGAGGNSFPNRKDDSGQVTTSNQFGIGGDHTFSNNDTLSAKFFYSQPDEIGASAVKFGAEMTQNHARVLATQYTHLFSPTFLMTAHYGFSWLYYDYTNQPGGAALLNAINAENFIPAQDGIDLVPQITIYPRFGVPDTGGNYAQYAVPQGPMRTHQFNVDVEKVRGSQTVSAGFLYMHLHAYDNGWGAETDFDQFPSSAITSDGSNVFTTGDGLASMLLDLPSGYSTTFGVTGADLTTEWYGGYVQDKWQATKRLSVQFGLRWDFQSPPHYKNNQFAMWNSDCPKGDYSTADAVKAIEQKCLLVPFRFVPQPTAGNPDPATWPTPNVRSSIWEPHYNGWQPRLGVAYSVTPRTVFRAGFSVFDDHNAFDKEVQDSRGSYPAGGSVAPSNLNRGIPSVKYDNLPSVDEIEAGIGLSVTRAANPNAKTPYVMQFNAGVQRQLTPSTMLEVNYVGSVSRHLWGTYAYNQPLPGTLGPNAIPNGQPFPFIAGVIQADDNLFNGNYNALQAEVERRFSQGWTFLAAYTYSKCLNEVGGEFDQDPQDTYDLAADYGRCNSDAPHMFRFSSIYELPVGRGRRLAAKAGKGLDNLIGGWRLSSITLAESGVPFTVFVPFDSANVGSTGRASYVPGCHLTGHGFKQSFLQWYNPACFTVPPPYTFGDTSRNAYRGPSLVDEDLAVMKNIKITASKTIQLRAEGFNLFNHTNLFNPGSYVDAPGFMQIFGAGPSREVQIAAKIAF